MRRRLVGSVLAVGLGVAAVAHATPPLAAYGRLPSMDDVEISPNGESLAVVVGDESHRQIQVRKIGTLKAVAAVEIGKAKVRALQWGGDDHLIITTSSAQEVYGLMGPMREYLQAIDLNLSTHKSRPLFEHLENSLNTVASEPVLINLEGHEFAFVAGLTKVESGRVFAPTLYKIDLDKGFTTPVWEAHANENTIQWLVDATGRPSARVDYDQTRGIWSLWLNEKVGWRKALSETHLIETPDVMTSSPDGQTLTVTNREGDKSIWRQVSAQDGVWSAPTNPAHVDEIERDDQSGRIVGTVWVGSTHSDYSFLSPDDQCAWAMVARAFPDSEVRLASWTTDRSKVIVRVASQKFGVGYFLVNLKTKIASPLGEEYAGIYAEDVAKRDYITYPAADGLQIPAYLTLPQGRAAKGLPLVVLVHGGPAARDRPGFDWWAQAIASRGYAVLQPQFRGSAGFSRTFLEAGFGQWGAKMQTDVSDGVRYLAKSGVIDLKRVCIAGGSYGGYAALAGAVFDPGVYRCAVADAPPADLRRLLDYEQDKTNSSKNPTIRYWDRFMGVDRPNDPKLDALSPARHADKAAIPILLIHGQDDTVVPYEQSRFMADALKRAGKPVQFVTLKGEDHWLSRSDTRLQMLTAMMSFIETNNPPDPAAPDATKTAAVASPRDSH